MALFYISFLLLLFSLGTDAAAVFTLKNNCKETIWAGILSGSGQPLLNNGGLAINANAEATVNAPDKWSGRFWPRNGCNFDQSGNGNCTTGDCGNKLQCGGAGGKPPASLAEFTLDSPIDFYDVSLVDGFNVPVSIVPSGGTGNCTEVKCVADLNPLCPQELQVKSADGSKTIACNSACNALGKPEYCCTGQFNNPTICGPTNYSKIFKEACPRAYSYPYDDLTSTFTCSKANYAVIFC